VHAIATLDTLRERWFASVAVAPSKAGRVPTLRAALQRTGRAFDADLDGVVHLVTPFANDAEQLAELQQLMQLAYGVRAVLIVVAGQLYTGASYRGLERWLPCYVQRLGAGMTQRHCPALARGIFTTRHLLPAGPAAGIQPLGCAAMVPWTGGTVEPVAVATPQQQLDALAVRLGFDACPWYRPCSDIRWQGKDLVAQ
jgi:hypothetical protein